MKKLFAVIAILFVLSLSTQAMPQVMLGKVAGNVTDSSGARIPGAAVTLRNEYTKVSSSVKTDEQGGFSLLVQPGEDYTVTVEFAGFDKTTAEKVAVNIGGTTALNVTLRPHPIAVVMRGK